MRPRKFAHSSSAISRLLLGLARSAMLLLVGCGGSSGVMMGPPPPPPDQASVDQMGCDAPADVLTCLRALPAKRGNAVVAKAAARPIGSAQEGR
jgi:hypothetical protein